MRYPIVRSNSKLSFVSQARTRRCSRNIRRHFSFEDTLAIGVG